MTLSASTDMIRLLSDGSSRQFIWPRERLFPPPIYGQGFREAVKKYRILSYINFVNQPPGCCMESKNFKLFYYRGFVNSHLRPKIKGTLALPNPVQKHLLGDPDENAFKQLPKNMIKIDKRVKPDNLEYRTYLFYDNDDDSEPIKCITGLDRAANTKALLTDYRFLGVYGFTKSTLELFRKEFRDVASLDFWGKTKPEESLRDYLHIHRDDAPYAQLRWDINTLNDAIHYDNVWNIEIYCPELGCRCTYYDVWFSQIDRGVKNGYCQYLYFLLEQCEEEYERFMEDPPEKESIEL